MTEEQKDPLDVEEQPAEEKVAPIGEEGTSSGEQQDPLDAEERVMPEDEKPAGGQKTIWTVAGVVVAILALCTCVVCLAAFIIAFSGGDDDYPMVPPAPESTSAPVPTLAPGASMIAITEPDQGQIVDVTKPVNVQGKGAGLPEGNVVVEAIDWQGNLLDRQPATLEGADVATGGQGNWSTELALKVEPGTAGEILAYAISPKDGSILAEDTVEVSLGKTAAVKAYVKIDEPAQGAPVDVSGPVPVSGSGAGLPEGNVVVEALDSQGNLLAQVPVTLQGKDVGSGGKGTWSTELKIKVEPGTAGTIRAYSLSPKDGSIIAEDSVEVSLGQTPSVESYIKIDEPAEGKTLDVSEPIRVSGTGGGLPEGSVIVVAVDENDNVLAEQPTTLEGEDVGAGGEGTWSLELAVPASGETPGYIAAFSTSPKQRNLVASDHVEVTFSGGYTLEGTTWVLDNTIPGSEITALFSDGQVSGSAGCNNYNGPYVSSQSTGKNTIQMDGPFAMTRMMCDEPLMDQEQLYMAALEAATEYTLEGFALSIVYPGGTMLFYDKDGPRPRD